MVFNSRPVNDVVSVFVTVFVYAFEKFLPALSISITNFTCDESVAYLGSLQLRIRTGLFESASAGAIFTEFTPRSGALPFGRSITVSILSQETKATVRPIIKRRKYMVDLIILVLVVNYCLATVNFPN